MHFKGYYIIKYLDVKVLGNENILTNNQKEIIDEVVNFYGNKTPQYLIDLTHFEYPCKMQEKDLKQQNEVVKYL